MLQVNYINSSFSDIGYLSEAIIKQFKKMKKFIKYLNQF